MGGLAAAASCPAWLVPASSPLPAHPSCPLRAAAALGRCLTEGRKLPLHWMTPVPAPSAELHYSSRSKPKLFGAAWIKSSGFLDGFFGFFCVKILLGHTPRPKPSPSCTSVPAHTLLLHFHHSQSASPLSSSSHSHSQTFCHGSSAICMAASVCVADSGVEASPKGLGSSVFTGGDHQGELRPGFSAGAPG